MPNIVPTNSNFLLYPDNAMAHYQLGLVYVLVDDRDSALEEYEILKDLDKDLASKLLNHIDFPPSAPEWGVLNCEQGVALAPGPLQSWTSVSPGG